MIHSIAFMTGGAVLAATLAGSVFMQGTPPEPTAIAAAPGYRIFKVVGNTVGNETMGASETVGTLAIRADAAFFAAPPAGGFLGVGSRSIGLPHRSFEAIDERPVLPDATLDRPKRRPDFKYID